MLYDLGRLSPPSNPERALSTADYSGVTPTYGAAIDAYVDEAFQGVGTGYASYKAAESSLTGGKPLSIDEYRQSEYYDPNLPYYDGLTDEKARILKEYNAEREKNAQVIQATSTGQAVVGNILAFGAGIFEPQNVATGVAASAVLTPVIGSFAPALGSLRNLIKMQGRAASYASRAGLGAAEGFVGAVIAEPLNRVSAKVLMQDYTMMDTMYNLGLSTAFGVGARTVPAYIKEKWDNYGAKAPDILAAEHDIALEQVATGRKLDVSEVVRQEMGDLTKKPIAEQAKVAEQFVRYIDTPEFKTRFEGSKIVDETGVPLRVYHGTLTDKELDPEIGKITRLGAGTYFTTDPELANFYNVGDGGNTRIAYLAMKNPLEAKNLQDAVNEIKLKTRKELHVEEAQGMPASELKKFLNDAGYDGLVIGIKDKIIITQDANQIIPAFGERNLNDIIKEANTTNKAASQNFVKEALSPVNDTAIDQQASSQLKDFEETLLTDNEKSAIEEYDKHIAEIEAMEQSGIATAKEDLMNALDSMNEADIEEAYKNLHLCLTRG